MNRWSYIDAFVFASLLAIIALGIAGSILQFRGENEQARRVQILWEAHQSRR